MLLWICRFFHGVKSFALGQKPASATPGDALDCDADATDPDDDVLTYTKTGADADKFTLNVATGELTFISPPDYENPADMNLDGVYEVTVTASDGTANATRRTRTRTGPTPPASYRKRAGTRASLPGKPGLKIRVAGATAAEVATALGATPVQMPINQVYNALQTEITIDGVTTVLNLEVAQHLGDWLQNAALAGTGGAIDRNNHHFIPQLPGRPSGHLLPAIQLPPSPPPHCHPPFDSCQASLP